MGEVTFFNQLTLSGYQYLVFDLRSETEFQKCHISCTHNTPLEAIDEEFDISYFEKFLKQYALKLFQLKKTPFIGIVGQGGEASELELKLVDKFKEGGFKNVELLIDGIKIFSKKYPVFLSNYQPMTNTKIATMHFPNIIEKDFFLLGNYRSAANLDLLKSLGVKRIVNAALQCENVFENDKRIDVKYYNCYWDDLRSQDIAKDLVKVLDWIDSEKSLVFVHCQMGISRSASIAIAWVMKHYKMDYDAAFKVVKRARLCVSPNMGFKEQLKNLDLN
ncbi:dual specificity protein phosphatase [Anaeramoeba flamelloides]|uniref:protein-tyrosine-phosphatase n=1 Tax=Anaeramoeba flamelloides TaxID=1746091 RepID=A0ABQ8XAU8_9EUKA|nr:dual specificity protein phosphatase [Anaeramoeba flamelloides]